MAKDGPRSCAQRADKAQQGQGIRAAIDQVPDQPQLVAIGRKAQLAQQILQGFEAALDVADGVT